MEQLAADVKLFADFDEGLKTLFAAHDTRDWQAAAAAPNMLQATSLEELATVLGPEG